MTAHLTFGLGLAADTDPATAALRAEQLGFDFVSLPDHPATRDPSYETWTALTWIAARTARIEVVSRVLGVPFRPPALVAKMAASLDRLSGGRLVLGLGGGYLDDEFRGYGLRVPSARDKVDGMAEAIEICRGLWTRPSFDYAGRLYRTEAAELEPKPARRIPIWLGTFGPRALAVTGRLADGWIPSYGHAPPDRIPAMLDRIRAAAVEAGRDPDAVRPVYHVPVSLGAERPENWLVSGDPTTVAERLAGCIELGFRSLSLMPVGDDPGAVVEQLAAEVIPVVRAP